MTKSVPSQLKKAVQHYIHSFTYGRWNRLLPNNASLTNENINYVAICVFLRWKIQLSRFNFSYALICINRSYVHHCVYQHKTTKLHLGYSISEVYSVDNGLIIITLFNMFEAEEFLNSNLFLNYLYIL